MLTGIARASGRQKARNWRLLINHALELLTVDLLY
jgi:hypothetical protein